MRFLTTAGAVMARFSIDDPFGADLVPEVRLPQTPLERVIAQVRFPPEPTLTSAQSVDEFRAPLRRRYPDLSQEHELAIISSPTGVSQQQGEGLWRLGDRKGFWKITLAKDFVALDATAYESREDFVARFGEVMAALGSVRPISLVGRLGVRYINRIAGRDATSELGNLVRPALVSMVRDLPYREDAGLIQSFEESVIALDDMNLKVRTALLPPGATIDPNVPPMDEATWVLDLDAFTREPIEFEVSGVAGSTERMASRIYRFFRWAMSDEAIERFGGEA